jgi:uncharacterized membrane protein YhhN
MIRSICLAAMFVVVAGVWAATPRLHAASWPVTAFATEDGAIVTQAMGARAGKCRRGEVYDKEQQKCVPAKEKPVKEKKTK